MGRVPLVNDDTGELVSDVVYLCAVGLKVREEDLLVQRNVVHDLAAVHEPGQLQDDEI